MSFGLLQMLAVMIGGWIFLSDFKKRPEFRQLPESRWWRRPGLLTVVRAYSRRDDDPLKPAHQTLARYVLIIWAVNLASIGMFFADPPDSLKPKPKERSFAVENQIGLSPAISSSLEPRPPHRPAEEPSPSAQPAQSREKIK